MNFIMKKISLFLVVVMSVVGLAIYTSSCDKSESETEASCNDNIENQGEEDVDCGGPCPDCPSLLCDGNGENTFMPIQIGYVWNYSTTNNMGYYKYKCSSISTINDIDYFKVSSVWIQITEGFLYYREAANGDIYIIEDYDDKLYEEERLLIPNDPVVGFSWTDPNPGGSSFKISEIDATYENSKCSYTGLVKITENSKKKSTYYHYYKRGLGLVKKESSGAFGHTQYLSNVTFD